MVSHERLNNIGAGATLAPILATQFISRGLLWSTYYFFTLGLQCLSVVGVGLSFRNEDAGLVRTGQRGKLSIAMHSKITWIASTFFFLYQGAEVAWGGWLVTFMIQVVPSAGLTTGPWRRSHEDGIHGDRILARYNHWTVDDGTHSDRETWTKADSVCLPRIHAVSVCSILVYPVYRR